MKKSLLTLSLFVCTALSYAGSKVTYTANIIRDAEKASDAPTVMRVSTNVLVDAFGRSSEDYGNPD